MGFGNFKLKMLFKRTVTTYLTVHWCPLTRYRPDPGKAIGFFNRTSQFACFANDDAMHIR